MHGLVNLAKSLRNLTCRRVNLTTLFSTGTLVQSHYVGSICG